MSPFENSPERSLDPDEINPSLFCVPGGILHISLRYHFIHSFNHFLFIHVHMYDCIPQAYHILLEFVI